ncbi:unnamed protein product [Brassica napus]|uniref:(rape) hypothetical protein n=1 Tax=Brassica napus TaxID=3708 RepID=A0A816NH63_BRANA|nr:unnamed protein product [Brassica napus]
MANMKTKFMALWDGFSTDQKMETMSSKFHMKMSNAVAFTKFASVDVVSCYHFVCRYLGHCHSWIWRKFLLRRRRR